MADLNVTYHPYIKVLDYDAVKAEVWYDLWPEDSEFRQKVDQLIAESKQRDALQITTANAVALPYTGTTAVQRTLWLKDRIDAVYVRLDLIRSLVDGYKAQIVNAGGEVPADPLKTIGSVLTIIPATAPVGAAITIITGLVGNDNGNAQWRAAKIKEGTEVITAFAQDAGQLQAIHTQLVAEYTKVANPTNNTDATSNAPNIRTDYLLYIVLAVVLLGLIVWVRLRKRKRSKR